jgi:hypothetical protein
MSEEKNTGEDAKAKMLAALAKKQKAQDLTQDLRLAQGKLAALLPKCIDANLDLHNQDYLAKWE